MPTRPRVLLADDHPGMVNALVRRLSPECDVVAVFSDGLEVAGAAARLQPVVTVVDLNLPNVSGLDVCRQITGSDSTAKVIVITAMVDDGIAEEVLAAGASGFLHKSAAADELVAAIKRAWAALVSDTSN